MSPAPIDNREGLHIVQDGNVSHVEWPHKKPAPINRDAELVEYIRRKEVELGRHEKPPPGFVKSIAMAVAVLGAVAVVAGIWGLMGCPGVDGFHK